MYKRTFIFIPLMFVISFVSCTGPTSQNADKAKDPNVTPEGVQITPDVVYGHKFGMALTFDMYQPKDPNGAGVIFLNDGGYQSPIVSFHKQTTEGLRLATLADFETNRIRISADETMIVNMSCFNFEPLLSKGFTFFNVRHGSSPKFGIPEIVSDLRRAVRFIRFHAKDYGINAERLGLWGGSAGGHLSLLLATTPDTGNSEVIEEFEKETGRVSAVVAYFPLTNLDRNVDAQAENNPDSQNIFSDLGLGMDQLREYSPIYFVSSDNPPTLIIHGEKDESVPLSQGESMYKRLLEAGVESKLVIIPDAGHGFDGEDADLALAEAVTWFEKHLNKK